ncbi:MAG: hypothetical protein IJ274_15115, partial [Lachnospiraceae bacterium]|nr:hypothetical protein [Lachnospiraceae bacterium]
MRITLSHKTSRGGNGSSEHFRPAIFRVIPRFPWFFYSYINRKSEESLSSGILLPLSVPEVSVNNP